MRDVQSREGAVGGNSKEGLFVNLGEINLICSPCNQLMLAADLLSELLLAWDKSTVLSSLRTNGAGGRRDWSEWNCPLLAQPPACTLALKVVQGGCYI